MHRFLAIHLLACIVSRVNIEYQVTNLRNGKKCMTGLQ